MLIVFAARQSGKTPSRLDIADPDAPLAGAFLNHLETTAATASGPATRAWPRSAPCSATPRCATSSTLPTSPGSWQSPPKRHDKTLITYLTEEKITALLAAPDLNTWTGRRDQALLMLACQTGLRATELTSLTLGDIRLGTGAHVSLGKGRKQRITPLTPATVTVLRAWLAERGGRPAGPLFATRRGTRSAAARWNGG